MQAHIPEIVPVMIPGVQALQEVPDQVEMEVIVPILPVPAVLVAAEVDFLAEVPEAMVLIRHLVAVAVVARPIPMAPPILLKNLVCVQETGKSLSVVTLHQQLQFRVHYQLSPTAQAQHPPNKVLQLPVHG
jgi:hypothetical protein